MDLKGMCQNKGTHLTRLKRRNAKYHLILMIPLLKTSLNLMQIVGGRAVAKHTIPSPNQFFNVGAPIAMLIYRLREYAKDITQAYKEALNAFYEAGVRYLQLDDVHIAGLSAPGRSIKDEDYSREQLIDLALRQLMVSWKTKNAEDLVVTTHLCRGNHQFILGI